MQAKTTPKETVPSRDQVRVVLPDWPYLVKDFRGYLGLSVFRFGELYGVTRQNAYNWEWGKVAPPSRLMHDIAEWVLEQQIKEGKNPYA